MTLGKSFHLSPLVVLSLSEGETMVFTNSLSPWSFAKINKVQFVKCLEPYCVPKEIKFTYLNPCTLKMNFLLSCSLYDSTCIPDFTKMLSHMHE